MRSLLCLIATFVASRARPPPAEYDTCSAPVQSNLRYGISGRRTSAGVPVKTNKDESLAEVVCCDSRALAFAPCRADVEESRRRRGRVTQTADSAPRTL